MIKHIIREVPPEQTNWEDYFDGDCFNENSGDYNNTIFPRVLDRHSMWTCLNKDEFERIHKEIRYVVYEVNEGIGYGYKNIKEIMLDYKLPYNPKNAHKLKEIAEADYDESEVIADYMTIKTGKKWSVEVGRGYMQGDYVELIYCTENYTEKNASIICDAILGCGKEFGVIEIDENGEEGDSCWGFFVTDSEAFRDEEYKAIVCKWDGLDESETRLEMIDGSHTYTKYTYRTA